MVQPTLVPELAPVVVNQPSPSPLVLNDNNVQMFNNFLSFLQNNNKSTSEPVVQQPKSLNLTTPVVQADAQSLGQTEDLLNKVELINVQDRKALLNSHNTFSCEIQHSDQLPRELPKKEGIGSRKPVANYLIIFFRLDIKFYYSKFSFQKHRIVNPIRK